MNQSYYYIVTVQDFVNDVEEYKFTFLDTALKFIGSLDFDDHVNFVIISYHCDGEL